MASSLPRLRTHFCSPACTAVMYRDIGTRSGGLPLPSPQGCRWQRSISRRLCCRGKGSSFSWSRRTSHTVLLNIRIFGYRAEQSIRGFCIGKKNWVMIDTIAGARFSAIVYSIAETAKANNLKPYDYFEYLLTEIPKHREDTDRTFLDDLLPWSTSLPENCRKPDKMKWNKTGANLLLSYRFAPVLYRYVLSIVYLLTIISETNPDNIRSVPP